MSTYSEYMQQIADLQKKAEEARGAEIAQAKAEIAELMQKAGLTLADLEDSKPSRKVSAPVAAKYRDPVSGQTWSGRGRAPKWLNGRNKEDFSI